MVGIAVDVAVEDGERGSQFGRGLRLVGGGKRYQQPVETARWMFSSPWL
jgi:hypothetical protein